MQLKQEILQTNNRNVRHANRREAIKESPLPATPFICFPARQCSFPDRKSLHGLPPHHRWFFNTSVATTNEPGVAAA